ncbi:hypothetical protein RQP46_007018 [Phenoliferia psychrophenolica]
MSTRPDGRTALELRSLALSQAVLSRQDGSAKFSFGNLSVLASVTGPAEVRIRNELVDRAALEINVIPLRGAVGPPSKSQETLLLSLLTPLILLSLHPRSLIQLTVQTLSAPTTAFSTPFSSDPSTHPPPPPPSARPRGTGTGAGEKAAMINASMLALVDAAVECRGMLLAAAVAFVEGEDGREVVVLDPTPKEEELASSSHVFAFSFGVGVGGVEGECVGVDSVGSFSVEDLFEAQDLAAEATRSIMAFVRRSIESRYGAEPAVQRSKPSDEMDVEA